MLEKKNSTKNLKFYSQKAISTATFIGEPLAAGYLIRENYLALDKPDKGKKALIIGLVSTVILFCGIFIPENIIDNIPKQIIPLLYTGAIYFIVEWIHGDILKLHKENNNSFFSGWKAAGIGFVSLVIMVIGIFGFVYIDSSNPAYDLYDKEMLTFTKNEKETINIYNKLNTESAVLLIGELNNSVIPKLKKNVEIIKRSNQIENLPSDLIDQNKLLLKYAELRIKAFESIEKSLLLQTDKYDTEINFFHSKIDDVLNELNSSNN